MVKKKEKTPKQVVPFYSFVEVDGRFKAIKVDVVISEAPYEFLNDGPALRFIENDLLLNEIRKLLLKPVKVS